MQGKVVLITGGAKRVGAAICQKLHAQGANLVVHYRSSLEEAKKLQNNLNQKRPDSVVLVRGDLLKIRFLPDLINHAVECFGRLDVLVNNASSFFPTPLGECTIDAWNDLIGSNLMAPLFLSQSAFHYLRQQQGCIVNIVDIHADRPLKNHAIYNLAKAGLVSLTKSLALDLAPQIRVNGVSPGPILWPEEGEWRDEAARQKIISRTLLKRTGEPNDIAKAVNFLIADAPYITGHIITVDGGRSIKL